MLKQTFLHIPGVNKNTELTLWKNNILSWDDYLKNYETLDFNPYTKQKIKAHIEKSMNALAKKDPYFFQTLPPSEMWRLYKDFKDKCCFLDIETTGLDKHRNSITTIGIFNGKESKVLINGIDMYKFEEEISKYKILVTFNGKCFDVPFLKAKFPDVFLDIPHIDLRYVLKNLGFSGGLKKIEKIIGICRDDELKGVNGLEAIRLWNKYQKGDKNALNTLVEYNKADIENLLVLMDMAYDKLREKDFLNNI